jgi:hypothetical protein
MIDDRGALKLRKVGLNFDANNSMESAWADLRSTGAVRKGFLQFELNCGPSVFDTCNFLCFARECEALNLGWPLVYFRSVSIAGSRELECQYGSYDGLSPKSAIVAPPTLTNENHTTLVIYLTKPAMRQGSHRDQERHLARCTNIPQTIKDSFFARLAGPCA